jgi:hypothetical protein
LLEAQQTMNCILILLFKLFVTGSDRSESDSLGKKSALPHSPAIAQFTVNSVKSCLSLYENYYFLFNGTRLSFNHLTISSQMLSWNLQHFFLHQVHSRDQFNTLFYKVLYQLLISSRHIIYTFETQRLEIFWKINLYQTV